MATVKMTRTLKPIAKPSIVKMSEDDVKRAAFAMAMRAALYEPEDDVVSLVEEEAPKPEPLRISAQWIRENQVPTTEERIVMLLAKGQMTAKRLASILHKRKTTINPILYGNSRFKIVGHDKEAPIWGLSD